MSGANFQCKKWIPPFFPLENLGNFKLVVFCFFLGGVGMQKKFFEHQHITALRELLTSCSGSTQSYFLFLACCNNWCNWCQTSSGCVSNQSRIFSNTRGHGPFSCSIRIWAHANDPVNWRVDSGSDSALSRFCCQLSSGIPFPELWKKASQGHGIYTTQVLQLLGHHQSCLGNLKGTASALLSTKKPSQGTWKVTVFWNEDPENGLQQNYVYNISI